MNNELTQKEFLILNILEGKTYSELLNEYDNGIDEFRLWYKSNPKLLNKIRRANQLFNGRKKKTEFRYFADLGKREFFKWFDSQPEHCCYCKIEAYKLEAIFDEKNGVIQTARKRGRVLELERIDTSKGNNLYTKNNCALACYLCNNHKSDLISKIDFEHFFAKKMFEYLEAQYKSILNSHSSKEE